jgi:hypothetical protein
MQGPQPKVTRVSLSKQYQFMYENFAIATQEGTYLLLEKEKNSVSLLYFDTLNMRYGPPNDEALGGHYLSSFGLRHYGFFEVINSPWIEEQRIANRVHPRHSDSLFTNKRHFIACFKDVTFEVICRDFEEKKLSLAEVEAICKKQLEYLTIEPDCGLDANIAAE